MISLEQAYEMAVGAIPGAATSAGWNLCREEIRRNLAEVFEGVEKPVHKYVEKPVENAGKSRGKTVKSEG